jgi:hypothetical protein
MEREFGGAIMTILGKILVILNLVFALVVGGLVVVVYSRSTNWEAAYKKQKENYEAARYTADQNVDEVKKVRDAQKNFEADLAKVIKDKDAEIQAITGQRDNAIVALRTEKEKLAGAQRELQVAQSDVSTAQKEKSVLEAALTESDGLNKKLVGDFNELNQRATTAFLDNKSLRERNLALAKQVKEYEIMIKDKGTTTAINPSAPPRTYPPTNVEGLVTQSDDRNGLFSISIGSDSGIEKGQTLDAWRIDGTKPQYLGTIKILDVRAKEAVARTEKDRVQVRVGDHVGKLDR